MKEASKEALALAVPCCESGCALSRLSMMRHDTSGSLLITAKNEGFTESEAFGIMDGWDSRGTDSYVGLYSQDGDDKD